MGNQYVTQEDIDKAKKEILGGGGTGTATADKPAGGFWPPAGFTQAVPGSNNTAWFNPQSGYIWSPSSTDPNGFTAHVSKIEADRIMGEGWSDKQKTDTTTSSASGPNQKPPAGFTTPVPGSNGTTWFNPASGYVWSPSSSNPAGFTAHVAKDEADRIMGAGWSDQQKSTTAAPLPTLPDAYRQMGFVQVGTNAFAPNAPHGVGKNATSGPATVYYDAKTNLWSASPIPISAEQYNLGMSQAKGGQTTQPSGVTPSIGAPPTTGMPAPAPAVPAATQMLDTGGKFPQQFTAPASLNPQTGFSGPGQTYMPHTLQAYYPPPGTMPVANGQSQAVDPLRPPSPPAGYGPVQDAKVYNPATAAPALQPMAQASAPGADQSTGPIVVNGVTFSPQAADAIKQGWPQELWPQAFALSARESGGQAGVDNGKSGPNGGPMNSDPKYGNTGTQYQNSIDYGLFGINDQNFKTLGLTPETARDPVANAAAAYQLYQRAGNTYAPWTGNGTIPLPTPADPKSLGTGYVRPSQPNQPNQPNQTPAATTQAVDPLRPPGSSGIAPDLGPPIYTTGQQTGNLGAGGADPNNRVTGLNGATGFSVPEILRGHGIQSTGSPDKDMVIAAGIVRAQQNAPAPSSTMPQNYGQSAFYQGEKSGPLEWVTRSDSGYSFEPGKVNGGNSLRSPIGGSDTPVMTPQGVTVRSSTDASPAQQAQNAINAGLAPVAPTSNPGAVYQGAWNAGSNPQYGNAANMPSQDALMAIAAAQAEKDRQDALGGADGPVRGFATGGSVQFNPNAPVNQRDLAIALANFGKKEAGPAESKFSSIASQQWNPNDDLRMRNFAAGGDVAVDPLKPTPADQGLLTPVANRQATTNAFMPTATPGAPDIMSNDVLKPYQDAQQRFANSQHLRDVTQYQRTRAGLGAGQGIEVTGDTLPTDPLRPGQFYDPSKLLNQRMGDITGLQTKITGYGETGDPAALRTQQAGYGNQITGYNTALGALNSLHSLGTIRDPEVVSAELQASKDRAAPYAGLTGLTTQLQALGNPQGDPAQLEIAAQNAENPQPHIIDGVNDAPSPNPGLALQLRQQAQNIIDAGKLRDRISALDPTGQGQSILSHEDTVQNALGLEQGNYQSHQKDIGTWQGQLRAAGLDPATANEKDINGLIGTYGAKRDALDSRITNATNAADARTTLSNLIARKVPQFAGGGSMVTQEPIVGIPARELMSHQTPQFMVGEPQQPGGPPMAEKLNIQPLNRPSMSPRVQRLVPNLADPLRPIGAAA